MPAGPNAALAHGWMGDNIYGTVIGGVVRDPQSATLTTTIEGYWVRVKSSTNGKPFDEYRVADTSKAFTASKDTYVCAKQSDGSLFYVEVANGAAKPTQATIDATGGTGSLWLAKVVTDGSRVTDGGVTDLRSFAGSDQSSMEVWAGFTAAAVGAATWKAPFRCRILKAEAVVVTALAGTDAGTVTLAAGTNDKYTNMTNGVITLALSSAVATRASCLPSDNYILDAGQSLKYTTAKTTAGGEIMLQVFYDRVV